MATKLKFPSITRVTKIRNFSGVKKLAKTLSEECIVIVDAGFHAHYFQELEGLPLMILSGGEQSKTWEQAGEVLQALAARKMERGARIVAVGGGAHCDLVAMVASLYRRGVPLVLVPTTLLSLLDASVGGKTAVDTIVDGRRIKNFAGTFYPAEEIWLCPKFLATLPASERRSGTGELLKMLWLFGKKPNMPAIQNWLKEGKISTTFWRQVEFAIQAKGKIVAKDPYDLKRLRECLNYGHTVGHAVESMEKDKCTHGEAVAWGMWAETAFAKSKFAEEIIKTIQYLGFTRPPSLSKNQDYLPLLQADKKMTGGKLAMTVAVGGGRRKKLQASPEALANFLTSL